MNISKHFMLSLSMVLIFATGFAQSGTKTHEDRAKALTEKMKTALILSDEQYSKVYDVNLKYAEKNDEIAKGSDSRMTKFKTLKATNDDKTAALKSIFTEEQFKKYKTMQKELRQDAKEVYKNKKGE